MLTFIAYICLQDVSNNLIEKLPPSIGELSGLKRLDLQSNKVEVFPEGNTIFNDLRNYFKIFKAICRLHITQLNVSDNLIQQLPTSIRKMSMLVELQVDGNPLSQPPPQVIFCAYVFFCIAALSVMLQALILSITCLLC